MQNAVHFLPPYFGEKDCVVEQGGRLGLRLQEQEKLPGTDEQDCKRLRRQICEYL